MQERILPIDSAAVVRQFDRLSRRANTGPFLTAEVAKRMAERLDYIRLAPRHILDAGCGAGHAVALLAQRYKNARILGIDTSVGQLDRARRRWPEQGMKALWRKATGGPKVSWRQADALTVTLDEPVDLLWTNCMLHWVPQPHAAIAHWAGLLAPGGLLMLSCFGPDTFKEVRAAAAQAGLAHAVLPFVDMHDFGDMLVASRLATPVMDAETLTLTYANAQAVIDDLRLLGGNAHSQRSPGLTGKVRWRRFINALESQAAPDGRIALTVEVIYGHAWKPLQDPQRDRMQVSVEDLAATLPSRRRPGA
jgi:malonyl-CoA O-methyltransferase